jgi:capsular exopolysaccharide synthesis family protein
LVVIGRQLSIVRRWLPLLLAGLLIGGVSVYLLTARQPKAYQASATLALRPGDDPSTDDIAVASQLVNDWASMVGSGGLAAEVATRLGLDATPGDIQKRLSATVPPGTASIVIQARDQDPALVAPLANAAADVLQSMVLQQVDLGSLQVLRQNLRATDANIKAIKDRMASLRGLESVPLLQGQVEQLRSDLQGQLSQLTSTYTALFEASAPRPAERLAIADVATEPTSPTEPRPLIYALVAAVAGLLLAAAIAFVLESFDDTLRRPEEVEEATGLPILSTVAEKRGDARRGGLRRLVMLWEPRTAAVEAYRNLRATVDLSANTSRMRTIQVTGIEPARGRSVVAANLALAFAFADRRVVLLDADWRDPGVDQLFEMPAERGLSDLLQYPNIRFADVAKTSPHPNLWIIAAGKAPNDPAELLGASRLKDLVTRLLGTHVDLVVIDAPSLPGTSDAALISAAVDATIVVIDRRGTHQRAVAEALDKLTLAKANVLGTVLFRMARGGYRAGRLAHQPAKQAGRGADAGVFERLRPS